MDNMTQLCPSVEDINSSYNPPVIILTFILGFIGNVIALWIFGFHVKSWKPNTVYSLNLAVADTLLICCLPFRADYFVREKNWIFGDVACRLKVFLISLNRVGSIAFLTVMAIDRYFKVVHPHHKVNRIAASGAVKGAGILWIAAVAISVHLLTEEHTFEHSNRTYCEPFNIHQPLSPMTIWTNTVFILFKFILPASIILFSTSSIIWKLKQMKTETRIKYKRAVKLVIAVAAVFIFCFLPTNVAVIAVVITKQSTEGCKSYETAVHVFYNTLFMTYLNSVLDPVIYYFSSSTFKDALKKALVPLNLSRFRSATGQGIQPREPKIELVVDQHLKEATVCTTCNQSQSEYTVHYQFV
uniref:hydroxycarboxylic acid receptor 3-like n=1 Tax=Pristiophorus japonicus TaxID=55135 RepID=UPI00398F55C9